MRARSEERADGETHHLVPEVCHTDDSRRSKPHFKSPGLDGRRGAGAVGDGHEATPVVAPCSYEADGTPRAPHTGGSRSGARSPVGGGTPTRVPGAPRLTTVDEGPSSSPPDPSPHSTSGARGVDTRAV